MPWSIYGLGLPSAKENDHDTWNIVQDLCVFVSNQETFAIKSCMQRLRAFNVIIEVDIEVYVTKS